MERSFANLVGPLQPVDAREDDAVGLEPHVLRHVLDGRRVRISARRFKRQRVEVHRLRGVAQDARHEHGCARLVWRHAEAVRRAPAKGHRQLRAREDELAPFRRQMLANHVAVRRFVVRKVADGVLGAGSEPAGRAGKTGKLKKRRTLDGPW